MCIGFSSSAQTLATSTNTLILRGEAEQALQITVVNFVHNLNSMSNRYGAKKKGNWCEKNNNNNTNSDKNNYLRWSLFFYTFIFVVRG